MQSQTYTYTVTADDFLTFLKFTEKFNLGRAGQIAPYKLLGTATLLLTVVAIISLGYHLNLNPDARNWPLAVAILCFLAAIGTFASQYQFRAQRYFEHVAREEGFMLGEHTVRIDDDGISEDGVYSQVKIPWQSVYALYDEPEHLYVYIGNMICLIIPKRAFPDRQEYERVYQSMQARLAN